MSKEHGEYEVPGQSLKSRNIRQTLNGVRRLAGNNPIADVLEFRKEYTVVDLSQRSGSAAAASDQAGRSAESPRPVHGPRPAWSRSSEFKLRYGRQSGELNPGAWPERAAEGEENRLPVLTMKDTIRAARAFFNPTVVEETSEDDASSDPEREARESSRNTEQAAETTQVPAVRHSDAGVPTIAQAQGREPAEAEVEDAGPGATEELLDEIACEIVEDALVSYEDEEADAQLAAAADDDEDDGYAPLLFLREDDEDENSTQGEQSDSVLLFDDVEDTVRDLTADDEADATPETHARTEVAADENEHAAEDDTRVRRKRRPGPRLPIGGLTPLHRGKDDDATPPRSRNRTHETPKWSASARHHMSDMLASAPADTVRGDLSRPRIELPRIDSRPERHRRSSAMLLLGLPLMLLAGFGAAYVYHASNYNPGVLLDQAQDVLPASVAPVPQVAANRTPTKISESIIQKQQSEEASTQEEALPPPVAPPVAEDGADTVEPAATKATAVATAETPPTDAQPAAESAEPVAEPPAPARIEPAAAPVSSAMSIVPAPISETEAALPKAVSPDAAESSDDGASAGGDLAANSAEAGESPDTQAEAEAVAPGGAETGSSQTQLAALSPSDSAPPEEPGGEVSKLIERGNKRLMIGDIAAARLLFELAAENGSAAAATAMGRSYDPVYFARIGVRGVKPDAETARTWYEKAVAAGDMTAKEDLRNLAGWMQSQQ